MTLRAIHLFPEFDNIDVINMWRLKYDPLSNYIPPHITLCFPFESNISLNILEKHITQVLSDISFFNIILADFSMYHQEYLFLNVQHGYKEIIDLHQRLYSGILKPYLNSSLIYIPHVTIGRFKSSNDLKKAYKALVKKNFLFETTIKKIFLERIKSDQSSIVEFIHHLG